MGIGEVAFEHGHRGKCFCTEGAAQWLLLRMLTNRVFNKVVLAEETPKAQAALKRADARVAKLVPSHVGKLCETHEANIALVRTVVPYGLIARLARRGSRVVVHFPYSHSPAFTSGSRHLHLQIHPPQLYTLAVLPAGWYNASLAFPQRPERFTFPCLRFN